MRDDGANKQAALNAKVDYNRLLHFLQPATVEWETEAFNVSALTGEGVPHIWDAIKNYKEVTSRTGALKKDEKNR